MQIDTTMVCLTPVPMRLPYQIKGGMENTRPFTGKKHHFYFFLFIRSKFSELFRVYPGMAISHRRKAHLSICSSPEELSGWSACHKVPNCHPIPPLHPVAHPAQCHHSCCQWKGYFFFCAKCQNLSCTPFRQESCLPNGMVLCGAAEFRAVKSCYFS